MASEAHDGLLSPERMIYFSDAVIAIAMTLLALDLPLPTGSTDAARWRSFADQLDNAYLSFALSFVVIAAYWSAHHKLFRYVTRVGPGLVPRNMLFLFALVVVPFASRLVSEDGEYQVAVVVYAATVILAGTSLLLLMWHAWRAGLLRADTPPDMLRRRTRGVLVWLPAFVISIPVAFVDTSLAKWSWLVLSVASSLGLRGFRAVRGLLRTRRPAGTGR